jgi:quercetin dioxygenase-like cupin family protein
METGRFEDLQEAWIDDRDGARWRSASGHAGAAMGSSLLEVPAGCHLPLHTDSAEETVVVVDGTAEMVVGGERATVAAGDLALVPRFVPHEVHNVGDGPLRFAAVYAAPDVVTTYDADVQPGGGRERKPTPS